MALFCSFFHVLEHDVKIIVIWRHVNDVFADDMVYAYTIARRIFLYYYIHW